MSLASYQAAPPRVKSHGIVQIVSGYARKELKITTETPILMVK
jgi:hypothetical protein